MRRRAKAGDCGRYTHLEECARVCFPPFEFHPRSWRKHDHIRLEVAQPLLHKVEILQIDARPSALARRAACVGRAREALPAARPVAHSRAVSVALDDVTRS